MKIRSPIPDKARAAYSLIEILVAAGILILVVAVTAALSLSLSNQEEQSARTAVALNYHEQMGRLWQLGLAPAEIEAIRPPQPLVTSLIFTESDVNFDGIGTLRQANSTITFRAAATLNETNPALRTHTILLLRPIP